MAPVKPRRTLARKSATAGPSKSKTKPGKLPLKLTKQVKTKPGMQVSKVQKKKKPQYTDAQLNLPSLNSIVPAAAKASTKRGTGKKKNKVFVDDQDSMMTILAMVNAEKEGQIESKMIKERRLEEIRDARRKEAEKRAETKKGKFEEVKMDLKKKTNRRKSNGDVPEKTEKSSNATEKSLPSKKKRVSFA